MVATVGIEMRMAVAIYFVRVLVKRRCHTNTTAGTTKMSSATMMTGQLHHHGSVSVGAKSSPV